MINCQSHQDLNMEHKTKHRKVLLWGNTLVSVIIKAQFKLGFSFLIVAVLISSLFSSY